MKSEILKVTKWNNIDLSIKFTHNYFEYGKVHHIEVKADQPLPITKTGYRSIFLTDELESSFDFVTLVIDEIEIHSKKQEWIEYQAQKKAKDATRSQLSLF